MESADKAKGFLLDPLTKSVEKLLEEADFNSKN
jgi:hypothetical protein